MADTLKGAGELTSAVGVDGPIKVSSTASSSANLVRENHYHDRDGPAAAVGYGVRPTT